MKFINLLKKYSKIRFAAVFTLAGLIISVVAGIMFLTPDTGTYEAVNVTITNIESEQVGEDVNYTVYVTYDIDGKTYDTILNSYTSGWKVGDVIECEYDVANPTAVRTDDGKKSSLIIFIVGIAAIIFGVFSLIKGIRTSSNDFAQYDRVTQIDEEKAAEIRNSNEPKEQFVFHFTGKLNQSFVMKNSYGEAVYEAICNGVMVVKDTEYEFKNCVSGSSSTKMISHTVTNSVSDGTIGAAVKSSFKIDGKVCWDVLADMGYAFDFGLNGIKAHYEVRHHGVNIGYVELGGTGLMNEKYKDNPLGKIPSNGIFKIECPKSEIEGMFLICFCLSRTEETLS